MKRSSALIALLVLAFAAHAQQLYKWVDKDGKVHYSDKPPAGSVKESTTLKAPTPAPAPSAPPAAAGGSTKSLAERELEFRKRQVEQAEAEEKAKQEAKVKQENCLRARSNLTTIQEGGRLFRYNAQGEREYIDDATRQRDTAKWQAEVQKWCQ